MKKRNATIGFLRIIFSMFFLSSVLYLPAFSFGLTDFGLQNFYLDIGTRPQGMGRTFIGIADDENSCFYNPGGLPWSKGIMVYAKDAYNIAAAQAYPTGFGSTIGITVVQTGISSFQATSGQFVDYSSNILILSAASKLSALPIFGLLPQSQNIGIGINLKSILGQTLRVSGAFDRTGSGWELDAGVMYKPLPWLSIGLNGQNIMPAGKDVVSGGVVKWDNGDLEPVPFMYSSGVSAKIIGDVNSPLYLEGNELKISADVRNNKVFYPQSSIGLEWNFRGLLFLRGGTYQTDGTFDSSSYGAGVRIGGWGFDTSYYTDFLKKSKGYTFSFLYDPEEWAFEKKPDEIKFEKLSIRDPIQNLMPSEEVTTYDDSILVSGKAKQGVSLSINGQTVLLDANGSFVGQVPLNPGKNLILIDIFYGNGKESITRKILRKPKILIAEERQLKEELKTTKTDQEKEQIKSALAEVEQRKQKVEALVAMGVVDIAPQSEFKLEAPVSRGELASWLVKAANLPLPRVTGPVFSDVQANHPYAPFIKAAVDNHLMQGQGNKFFPNTSVSKSEAQNIFRKFGVIK